MAENIEISFGATMQRIMGVADAMDRLATKGTGLVNFFQKPINWDNLGNVHRSLDSFANNMQRSSDAVLGFMQPGINFEAKMAELKAGTGATDEQLKLMSDSARKNAVAFGIDASQGMDSYLAILGKLTPELAKSPAALEMIGKTAAMLSKGMGNDLKGSTDALITMANSFNIKFDGANAMDGAKKMASIADMLTVSFKNGSADVGGLAAGFKTLGPNAYLAGVSMEETMAVMQTLNQKGGKEGAEMGIAMRNMMGIMSKGELLPEKTLALLKQAGVSTDVLADKTASLTARMNVLKNIKGSQKDAILGEYFGTENKTAGLAALNDTAAIDTATQATRRSIGENAKYSATIMQTTKAQMERMKSIANDTAISMYNTLKPYVPMISVTSQLATTTSALLPLFSTFGTLIRASVGGFFRYILGITTTTVATQAQTVATAEVTIATQASAVATVEATVATQASTTALTFQKNSLLGGLITLAKWTAQLIYSSVVGLGGFIMSLGRAATYKAAYAAVTSFATVSLNGMKLALLGAGTAVGGFVKSIYSAVTAQGFFSVNTLRTALTSMVAYGASMVSGAMATFGFNAAVSANPIGLFVLGIVVLGGAIYGLVKYFGGFEKALYGVWNWVKEYNPFSLLLKAFDAIFGTNTLASVKGWFNSIGGWLDSMWDKVKGVMIGMGIMTDVVNKDKAQERTATSNSMAGNNQMNFRGDPLGRAKEVKENTIKGVTLTAEDKIKMYDLGGDDKKKQKKGLDGVSGGGSKQTNITINLQKLQDQTVIHTTNLKEGTQDVEKMMIAMLQRVLNGTNQYQAG